MSGDDKPDEEQTTTPPSSTPPGTPGVAVPDGRGGKIVLPAPIAPLSQHQREWLRRTCEEIRERRAMPPHLRAHYEGLAREADARDDGEKGEEKDEEEGTG